MEQITITLNHTSLEEASLLVAGGISSNTADMIFECLPNQEPKVHYGYDRRIADYYARVGYFKPCWSEKKLRLLIQEYNMKTNITSPETLIPTLLACATMRDAQLKAKQRIQL